MAKSGIYSVGRELNCFLGCESFMADLPGSPEEGTRIQRHLSVEIRSSTGRFLEMEWNAVICFFFFFAVKKPVLKIC